MAAPGFFTPSDMIVISRAAILAEKLTQQYFELSADHWVRDPYGIFTRKETGAVACSDDAFAQVVKYRQRRPGRTGRANEDAYAILLQDPNILRVLLRSSLHDLWTLGLFVLTHELIHIVRFREFGVDFFATQERRNEEEKLVHGFAKDILAGVSNTDYLLDLYQPHIDQV